MSDLIKAVELGLVEGLTEFIPVSSTGHLILFGNLIGFTGEKAATFEVFIQLGAILAVVFIYFSRFLELLNFKSSERVGGFSGLYGISKLFLVSFPALALGAVFHGAIKKHLFGPVTVAAALIVGGVIFLIIEHQKREPRLRQLEEISFRHCFYVGLFQALALWPGMSRSGSTMIGGMLLGFERKLAAEFSFLAAVPVMCAAVGYDLLKSAKFLSIQDLPFFATGFTVSFITAILAIKFFLRLLGFLTLKPFGYYRIVLGVVVLLLS